MKFYLMFFAFLFSSILENQKNDLAKLDCSIVHKIIESEGVSNILDLTNEFSKSKYPPSIRIIDTKNAFECQMSRFECLSKDCISGTVYFIDEFSEKNLYNFNTGLNREILVNYFAKRNHTNNRYILSLTVYEYGCQEVKTDLYSASFTLEKDNLDNFTVVNVSYGDID